MDLSVSTFLKEQSLTKQRDKPQCLALGKDSATAIWTNKRVQRQLNDRPRKALGFYKPNKEFNKLVALEV